MRMVPIFSLGGQLLGHVDTNMYSNNVQFIQVDDGRREFVVYDPDILPETTLNTCTLWYWTIPFQNKHHRTTKKYLVADVPLPDWFWDAWGTVKFEPEHWDRRLRREKS